MIVMNTWPFKEIIQAAACTAVVYLSSERIRNYCLKSQAWYQNQMIQWEAVSSKEIKHLMFEEIKSIINSESGSEAERTMLEIGVGCGKNFPYYTATSLIGLESNSFCEAYAWQNSKHFKHIHIKEYLIGFPENMSFIRNNSIQVVLATMPDIHDYKQTLEEVYRILKHGGLFIYLEDRLDVSFNWKQWICFIKKDFKKTFKHNISGSKFGQNIMVERLFKNEIYSIARK